MSEHPTVVLVIGLGPGGPALPACRVHREAWPGYRGPPASLAGGVLVVGPAALRHAEPEALRLLHPRARFAAVLCPDEATLEELPRWFRAGFERVAGRERLPEVVVAAAAALRRRAAPGAWSGDGGWLLPPRRDDGEATRALRALALLQRQHSVAEWAERLGWSRKRLRRTCARAFGLQPRKLLLAAVARACRQDRAAGLPRSRTVERLGYFDVSALRKAERAGQRPLKSLAASGLLEPESARDARTGSAAAHPPSGN